MSRRSLVLSLLAVWAATFVAAFLAFSLTAPSGDGFTRGLNRIGAFLGWQAAAGTLGLVLALVSRPLPPGRLRRLALLPLGLFLAGVLAIVAAVAWANLTRPGTLPPPGETTAPSPDG